MFTLTLYWYLIIPLCIALYLLYLIYLKPFQSIQYYKQQGIKMRFAPFDGIYKSAFESLASTKDFYGWLKQEVRKDPNVQMVGGNFIDKAYLYLISPDLIKEFYQKQDNYVKGAIVGGIVSIIHPTGLITSEGEHWKRHRKVIASAFHYDLLRDMVPGIVKSTEKFLRELRNQDLNNVEIVDVFQDIIGEVICELFFGSHFSDYRVRGLSVPRAIGGVHGNLGDVGGSKLYLLFGLKVIRWKLLPKAKRIIDDLDAIRGFAIREIEQKGEELKNRKEGGTAKDHGLKPLIEILLSQQSGGSGDYFNREEIVDEFMTFFGAGTDTTSWLIAMAVYYLHENPQYKDRLMKEIDENFSDSSKVTLDTLNYMEFMTAFMKETLRIASRASVLLDREVVKDHTLGNIKIKKGTIVNIGMIANSFSPAYHDNENTFDPDRWLDPNSKTRQSMAKNSFVYIPFSSGVRNCIGQHLAMNEAKVIFSIFLKSFDFSLNPNYKHVMTQGLGYGPADPLAFKLIPKGN